MKFADIKIRSFTGDNFKEFIPSIARLKLENYKEYPYLYEANLEEEKKHLRAYAEHPHSIAILVFEGSTIVGVSIGVPFILESAELQKLFIKKPFNLSAVFYFDVSFLLKKYRGRGITHHFYDLRENHAKSLPGIEYTCFFSVQRPEEKSPIPPPDYLPLYNFWRKRGYILHPEITKDVHWEDIGNQKVNEKQLCCWMKEL